MQTITDDLRAILKAKFQAAADGFRGRLEIAGPIPLVCSTSLAAAITASATGDGTNPNPSVAITPTAGAPALLIAVLMSTNRSTPKDMDVTDPSGYTLLGKRSAASPGLRPVGTVSYKAVASASGSYTATDSYTPGDTASSSKWIAAQVAIKTTAAAPVQSVFYANGSGTPTLPGAPTPGNILIAVVANVWGLATALDAGWTSLFSQVAVGLGYDLGVSVWARCVAPGDSATWNFTRSGYSADFCVSISEWAITGSGGQAFTSVPGVTRVSIDKSLQTDADAFEVELDNTDGAKSLYPAGDTYLPTKRARISQWYGDSANAVQTFDGFIDKSQEHRNPRTVALTGRDWMKRLLVQDILVTAPQGADEDGAVRTTANYVYLNMEVSDIVLDLLAKANYPADKIRVQQTSYQVAEFLGSDGNSFADALGQLADLVGYGSFADELGWYVFEANARSQSTDTDTPDAPVWTFRASEDIVVIDPEQDDYDLKTRIRVTGPMSTTVLNDAFTELWHSAAVKKPTGVWFDATDAGNVRVADGATRRLYKVSQSTRAIVSSTAALCSHFLGDVTGDPSDASKYWILELPWKNGLPGTASTVYQLDKATNAVLASFALPSGRWVGMDVDATHVWLANWDTNKIHKYTRAGASVASYTFGSNVDPTGVIVDGTTLYTFWYNTNQILVSTTAAPTTITKTISTAGTQMLGGEVDSVTHTEFWACSDSLGLTWKHTLVEPVTTERTVYVEVTNDAVGVNSSPGLSAFETALGEVRRSVVRMDAITSLAQATETAQRWLSQLDHTRQTLDVGIIGNPAITKGDMVRIVDPVSGIATDWGVDTYRSEMSGEAGTYLGTLSLLPWDPRY